MREQSDDRDAGSRAVTVEDLVQSGIRVVDGSGFYDVPQLIRLGAWVLLYDSMFKAVRAVLTSADDPLAGMAKRLSSERTWVVATFDRPTLLPDPDGKDATWAASRGAIRVRCGPFLPESGPASAVSAADYPAVSRVDTPPEIRGHAGPDGQAVRQLLALTTDSGPPSSNRPLPNDLVAAIEVAKPAVANAFVAMLKARQGPQLSEVEMWLLWEQISRRQ